MPVRKHKSSKNKSSKFKTTKIDERLTRAVFSKVDLIIQNLFNVIDKDDLAYLYPKHIMNIANFEDAVYFLEGNETDEAKNLLKLMTSEVLKKSRKSHRRDGVPIYEITDDVIFIINDPETGEDIEAVVSVEYMWDKMKHFINGMHSSSGALIEMSMPQNEHEKKQALIVIKLAPVMPKDFIEQTHSSIRHELVHLFDKDMLRDTSNYSYYEKPQEVLAYVSQIEMEIDNILVAVYKQIKENNKTMLRFLNQFKPKRLLERSPTWYYKNQSFSKNTIRLIHQSIENLYKNWEQKMQNPNIKMKDIFGYSQPEGGADISDLDY